MKISDEARKIARDAALFRWGTGSADTTQMLLSVDAALAALPEPAVTRSVEIPEEAVAKGAERLWLFRTPIAKTRESCTEQAREVIAAALPYLAPAGDGGLREALEELLSTASHYDTCDLALSPMTNQFGCSCLLADLRALLAAHPAAPAVPQPAELDVEKFPCACPDSYQDNGIEATYCPRHNWPEMEPWLREAGYTLIPAAVPQPVDREALRERIAVALWKYRQKAFPQAVDWDEVHGVSRTAMLERADAVLAVLAGEQEQVEK